MKGTPGPVSNMLAATLADQIFKGTAQRSARAGLLKGMDCRYGQKYNHYRRGNQDGPGPVPLWPWRLNLKGEGSAAPVLRSVVRLPAGKGLPAYLSSIGLGSNVSTCDGPPLR